MVSWEAAVRNFRNIHRETSMLESLFNKAAGLQAFEPATLLKRDFRTGVIPVNIAEFLRTAFL